MPPQPQKCSIQRLALAAALLVAGGAVQAQSLQSLYDAARAYDASYQVAKTLLEATYFRVEQAEARRWPRLDLTGSSTRADYRCARPTAASLRPWCVEQTSPQRPAGRPRFERLPPDPEMARRLIPRPTLPPF